MDINPWNQKLYRCWNSSEAQKDVCDSRQTALIMALSHDDVSAVQLSAVQQLLALGANASEEGASRASGKYVPFWYIFDKVSD